MSMVMTHFSEADLADFVRGVPVADEAALTAHLATCADCAGVVAALRAVADVALRDAVESPNPNTLHAAEAIFSMWRPERVKVFSTPAARLLFDSFADPVLAGIRSGPAMYRQLLYEARPYAIDLRLDRFREGHRMSITGQLATLDTTRPIAGVRVTLTSDVDARLQKQVHTNDTGEFYLEYEPAPRLNLRVDVESCPQIALPEDVHLPGNDPGSGRE